MDNKESKLFYEYGYTCGGILVTGFCQFINNLAKQEGVEKLIFVARDGYIMRQIYDKYFGEVSSEYLVFSRFASAELMFDEAPYEYINVNIRPRIYRKNADNSIGSILKECGITVLSRHINQSGLELTDILNEKNIDTLSDIILAYKEEIREEFNDSCEAAREYYLKIAGDSRKVCIVDIGWRGKSIVYLRNLLKSQYGWTGDVIGTMIGGDNYRPTQDLIRCNIVFPYVFENPEQRNQMDASSIMDGKDIICMEMLFSSEDDTLLRYGFNEDGSVRFIYGKKNPNKDRIRWIHSGIIDFCNVFIPIIKKYDLVITKNDAFAPLGLALSNRCYKRLMHDKYIEVPGAINGF